MEALEKELSELEGRGKPKEQAHDLKFLMFNLSKSLEPIATLPKASTVPTPVDPAHKDSFFIHMIFDFQPSQV